MTAVGAKLSRRGVLAGMGVIGGAVAVGAADGAVAEPVASTPSRSGFGPLPPDVAGEVRLGPAAIAPLTTGLTYRLLDMTVWNTTSEGSFRNASINGVGVIPVQGPPLLASIDPPIGATLKEVTVWYQAPDGQAQLGLFKKPLDAPVAGSPMNPTPIASVNPLPTGPGTLQATLVLDESIDGTATNPLVFFVSTETQLAAAIRFGYVAPPQAFIASTPVTRKLDTRVNAPKLRPGEERVIRLDVPPVARAAVINLTITETEGAGFVAVFPADTAWPGNSSINWSSPNQNLANTVITATDSFGSIRVRAGANATHVIIDVQGYLL
jgi:hypothetical protein